MRLVVDANILFAALVRDGLTRQLLFEHELLAPTLMLREFRKHRAVLERKTGLRDHLLDELLSLLIQGSGLRFLEPSGRMLREAERFSPDKGDVDYLALCLDEGCDLWSNDKPLRGQARVRVWSTEELFGSRQNRRR